MKTVGYGHLRFPAADHDAGLFLDPLDLRFALVFGKGTDAMNLLGGLHLNGGVV